MLLEQCTIDNSTDLSGHLLHLAASGRPAAVFGRQQSMTIE